MKGQVQLYVRCITQSVPWAHRVNILFFIDSCFSSSAPYLFTISAALTLLLELNTVNLFSLLYQDSKENIIFLKLIYGTMNLLCSVVLGDKITKRGVNSLFWQFKQDLKRKAPCGHRAVKFH